MARMRNGITSALSGKVGGLVTCNWKGIPYVRSRPAKVNHPNTEKQLAHRMRFSLITKFLSLFREYLAYTYAPYAIEKTAFNVAVSENMKSALGGEYPDIHIDYNGFKLSKGDLPIEENVVVSRDGDNIKFSWEMCEDLLGVNKYDRVVTLIYNADNADIRFDTDMGRRKDCEAIVPLPDNYSNYKFHCYMLFVTQEFILGKVSAKSISDSIYCGIVE